MSASPKLSPNEFSNRDGWAMYRYDRTIRFADTDAAGVVYFATVLSICHEAYEASLAASGIDLDRFFRGTLEGSASSFRLALPIVHAEIDFKQPLLCGKTYRVQVQPTRLSDRRFAVRYGIAEVRARESPASAKGAAQNLDPDLAQDLDRDLVQESTRSSDLLGSACAIAETIHVCIDATARSPVKLPVAIEQWLTQQA